MEDLDRICEICGGELGELGRLGKLLWLVCRNCGMQFSVNDEPAPWEEQEGSHEN